MIRSCKIAVFRIITGLGKLFLRRQAAKNVLFSTQCFQNNQQRQEQLRSLRQMIITGPGKTFKEGSARYSKVCQNRIARYCLIIRPCESFWNSRTILKVWVKYGGAIVQSHLLWGQSTQKRYKYVLFQIMTRVVVLNGEARALTQGTRFSSSMLLSIWSIAGRAVVYRNPTLYRTKFKRSFKRVLLAPLRIIEF